MNKSKTIYFLSAFVLIIGCYALNLSYSLFVDTQEKSILNASIPKLDSELSITSLDVEAGKEYLIKQTVANIGTVAMNYAVNASSTSENYTVKMAETDNNLSSGILDINSSKDLYIVVSNTGESAITINFTLDKNYTTLTSKVPTSNIVETTTVEYQDSFPYSDKPGTLAYHVINNFMNSDLYNPTNATTLSTENNIVIDIPGLFSEGENKISIPVLNPNAELDVPSPMTFTGTEENEVGLYKAEDDHGISYYFRGASSVNYVNFAGMCWRIVRINGDGSTKLILEDQYTTCDDNETTITEAKYTGNWIIKTGNYGYDSSQKNSGGYRVYKMNYLNPVTSKDKSMVKAFYDFQINKLAGYLTYLKSGDWCLGNNAYSSKSVDLNNTLPLSSEQINEIYLATNKYIYYDSYVRLYGNRSSFGSISSLKCNGSILNDFLNVSEVSTNIPMYVGAITLDEIVYAGGYYNSSKFVANVKYYIINYYVRKNNYTFWTFSPCLFDNPEDSDKISIVSPDGSLGVNKVSYSTKYHGVFRPVINLSADVVVTGGDGTKDTSVGAGPYTVGLPS